MESRRCAIVVTTIFPPQFLDGYVSNLRHYDRTASTEIIVIPDRKTPPSVYERCAAHAAAGIRVVCPTLTEQEDFLRRFPSMHDRIPYDSDNRRNIGFLMALDHGADVLISIDDDNYCLDDSDFVGEHLHAGRTIPHEAVRSSDGWINLCQLLRGDPSVEVYPRGFPYFARGRSRSLEKGPEERRRVAINAGLWLTDPDVDAVTRLALRPRVDGHSGECWFLADDTWTPVNTQNTSIPRDAAAAYYYVRMGFSVGGLRIDRYGDILSGYFLQKCAKSRGETVRIGTPVADHRRTPHNLFKDLYHELAGMVLIDDLLPWLQQIDLGEGTYRELYARLATSLEERSGAMRGFVWDEGGREFLRDTAAHMRSWLEAIAVIG
ncbi:MAG TPA: hypothetical protein VNL91_08350 [Thermoanaerobaculia bacterium]|nr:hypothetical protein [Thermoanaerobaculia bacterium]